MKKFDEQTRKGVTVAAAGIACNLLLSAAKIAAGCLLGLISVVADGFNNLGDCGSGIVSVISLRVAAKPADKEHPFGHRRAEYVASAITGFLVLVVAVSLLGESIRKVTDGSLNSVHWAVYIVLGASVVVKAAMFFVYRVVARKISSNSLKAAATDSLCDGVATGAVIVCAVLAEFGIAADGWAGIAVAVFIAWQGVKIVKEASSELLGQAPDAAQVDRIKATILSCNGVLGLHDLRIFTYGNGVSFATVHVEMDATLSAMQSHAVLDELEHEVYKNEGVDLTIHLDPVDLNDEQAVQLEQNLRKLIADKIDGAEIHDFRLIRGAADKLVFDVGVPFDCRLSDEEVEKQVVSVCGELGDFAVNVNVERE